MTNDAKIILWLVIGITLGLWLGGEGGPLDFRRREGN